MAEYEFQTIHPHAERIGAIDDNLAGEVAEALHRRLGGRPRCRKDNDFGISSRLRRGAQPLLGERTVFRIGGIRHAEYHVLSAVQPRAPERRPDIAGTGYGDPHRHLH
jgi:hypothetical protein